MSRYPDWRLTPTELAQLARDARRYAQERYDELAERVAALENGPDPLANYHARKTRAGWAGGKHRGDVGAWTRRRQQRRLARYARKLMRARERWRRRGRIAAGTVLLPARAIYYWPATLAVVITLAIVVTVVSPSTALRVLPGSQLCAGLAGPGGVHTAAWGGGHWLDKLEDAEPVTVEQATDGIVWTWDLVSGAVGQLMRGLRSEPAPAGKLPSTEPSTLQTAAAGCTCPGDSPVRQASTLDGVQVVPAAAVTATTGPDAIAAALVRAGATDAEALRLTAISGKESGFGVDLVNPRSSARGPFQLLLSAHPEVSEAEAMDLDRAAVHALRLARERDGQGIRSHWSATYASSAEHDDVARAAVARARGGAAAPAEASCTPASAPASSPAGGPTGQALAPLLTTNPGRCQLPTRSYPNGQLPATALCPLASAPGHQLRADAAAAWDQLMADPGRPAMLCVTDSYRTLAAQVDVARRKPSLAAVPGTSKHGLGIALDLCGGAESFSSPTHQWLADNAPRYGWVLPQWASILGSKPEPWHWEYVGRTGAARGA